MIFRLLCFGFIEFGFIELGNLNYNFKLELKYLLLLFIVSYYLVTNTVGFGFIQNQKFFLYFCQYSVVQLLACSLCINNQINLLLLVLL